MPLDDRPTVADPDNDPYLWLEDIEGERALDFVDRQRRLTPGTSRVITALSRGGSDAVTLREFDLDAKAFVGGGFSLPEAKSGVEWLDADTLLLSSALGDGMATNSGYARTVRLWRRGARVER